MAVKVTILQGFMGGWNDSSFASSFSSFSTVPPTRSSLETRRDCRLYISAACTALCTRSAHTCVCASAYVDASRVRGVRITCCSSAAERLFFSYDKTDVINGATYAEYTGCPLPFVHLNFPRYLFGFIKLIFILLD